MIDIGILIFNDVEELDFVGPWEVWNMVNTVLRAREERDAVRVRLISENGEQIKAVKNMRVLADVAIADVSALDIICIPGGQGVRPLIQRPPVIEWIETIAPTCKWVTSVCTGVFALSKAGLTTEKRITTHWAAFEEFEGLGLEGILVPNIRYIRDGNLVSSAGVSAGIDMALWLVGEMFSPQLARDVQRAMEYDPAPPYAGDV
jgi:transcriptional regulator GlxA family with amidase domain